MTEYKIVLMAEVLAPTARSSSTMTILGSPQDNFLVSPPNQSNLSTNRSGQMHRASLYDARIPSTAYRHHDAVETTSYIGVRHGRRKSAGPVLKHQAIQSVRQPYQSSSSSSVSSASSSSNRSNQRIASQDDSMVGYRQRAVFVQSKLSTNVARSLSSPDVSNSMQQPSKPSPERYRRQSRTQEQLLCDKNVAQVKDVHQNLAEPAHAVISQHAANLSNQEHLPPPSQAKPCNNSAADDSNNARPAVLASARYKRRPPKSDVVSPLESISPAKTPAPSWAQVVTRQHSSHKPLVLSSFVDRPVHIRSSSVDNRATSYSRGSISRLSSFPVSRSSPDVRPMTGSSIDPRPRSSLASPNNSSVVIGERSATADSSQKFLGRDVRSSTAAGRMVKKETVYNASPAVQQLSAIKEKHKGVGSKLRRAFSFSSSAELRKVTAENSVAAEKAKLRRERFDHGQDAEDAAIVAKQEASGLGTSIYSHQGKFTGSIDNVSMSSTVSSASMMLRNIGREMKKSTRNLRSIFKPKSYVSDSVVALASADSQTKLSLVTIEADREIPGPDFYSHGNFGSGAGSCPISPHSPPHRDVAVLAATGARKSISGGDLERAVVLARVHKSILKREQSLPSSAFVLATGVPLRDANESKEYFTAAKLTTNGSTRSLPTVINRNVSFGPRIQFFDVHSSSEYDRRGDIATCNRLTPMLAQQIKEELNTFKMEMEVHEQSKPHTHFF